MKRRSADLDLSIYPKPEYLSLWLQNRNSYFYSYKAWKNNYGSYLNWYISFILNFWSTSNTTKNETGKKFKSLLGINLVKYSSEFLVHLGHTDTSGNVQNNCVKLSGFGVEITRLSAPGNNEKHFVHRKVLQPEKSVAGF